MKINVLLFTQTMHSLLKSSLPLQNALLVCSEILSGNSDKKFASQLLKNINEGKKLADALSDYITLFSPLYISLISIGEESGTLPLVFERLAEYLKEKKKLKQKKFQSLAYPIIVLITAVAVIFVLTIFVMPRLNEIFAAFTESSNEIEYQLISMRSHFLLSSVFLSITLLIIFLCIILYKFNNLIAYFFDSLFLRCPFIGRIIITIQVYDFSFAMKLLSATHFPLVESLKQASTVLTNRKFKKSIISICNDITHGNSVGSSFESVNVFPNYLTVWIKIAEKNGNTTEAFSQICDYYSNENDTILANISSFAEPVFIIITGIIIISIIGQFVIPILNLLGAL